MKTRKLTLSVVMAMAALLLSGCEEDEYVLNIDKGKFVVLDEPYQHPYATDITIKAILYVEGDTLPDFPDGMVTPYFISGHIPAGYNVGDTAKVRAKIKEIYPKGPALAVLDNVTVYKLKDIERIK